MDSSQCENHDRRDGWLISQGQRPCASCSTYGEVFYWISEDDYGIESCRRCGGTGFVSRETKTTVQVKIGIKRSLIDFCVSKMKRP